MGQMIPPIPRDPEWTRSRLWALLVALPLVGFVLIPFFAADLDDAWREPGAGPGSEAALGPSNHEDPIPNGTGPAGKTSEATTSSRTTTSETTATTTVSPPDDPPPPSDPFPLPLPTEEVVEEVCRLVDDVPVCSG